ncbi:YopX family protein [Bacillus toyonensis]|uniref:YopX family protein n=1 Tax=Bacillus toyonensis TaxID=155322 RepID=UPI00217607DB|nr:YopX family protein [Bacillus toyonensis]
MVEIEFRAWDGKVMHENVVVVDGFAYKRGYFATISCKEAKAGTPMQYTGLKDKNGKKIFEGDILESTSELLTNFGNTRTGRYATSYEQVIWMADSWGIKTLKSNTIIEGSESKGLRIPAKYGVVCGNIYENPELLGESK